MRINDPRTFLGKVLATKDYVSSSVEALSGEVFNTFEINDLITTSFTNDEIIILKDLIQTEENVQALKDLIANKDKIFALIN